MASLPQIRPSIAYRIRAALGGYSPLVRFYHSHRPTWLWVRLHALGRVTRRFVAEHGTRVQGGGFAGLEYGDTALGHVSFLPAKLMGSYEPKVVSTLIELGADADLFVDIGSGEGYFCVGMARAHPHLRVIGFELTNSEREFSRRLAAANGVEIEVQAGADTTSFAAFPPGRGLVLVDVEGYEAQLLDPAKAPRLLDLTLVVELHEPDAPGIEDLLRSRFERSHEIDVIEADRDDPSAHREVAGWPAQDALLAVTDGRGYLGRWMVLVPR